MLYRVQIRMPDGPIIHKKWVSIDSLFSPSARYVHPEKLDGIEIESTPKAYKPRED